MKLLFDQNISYRIPPLIEDIFPESKQVREAECAKPNAYSENDGFLDNSEDILILGRDYSKSQCEPLSLNCYFNAELRSCQKK